MIPERAVILAGGKGMRLRPYTTIFPKPLMPIAEKPILEIVVQQLKHAGVKHITFAVGYLAELIQAFFGNGEKWGVYIDYSREEQVLGTAAPLKLIPDLNDDFLVMNGDILCNLNYQEMFQFHRSHGEIVTIGTYNKQVKIDLGVLEIENTTVKKYIEKPVLNYPVSMGIYCFQPAILDWIPEGQAMDLPDLIQKLILAEKKPQTYLFEGLWLDIGRASDYEEAQDIFVENQHLFIP
jgi:NDP-mannose synthase